MAGKVTASEDGYTIRGIAPPGLAKQSDEVKLLFWSWVVEIGLEQKDRDLAQGLDRDGKPLRAISAATRKHRVSAMTPTGKGDPGAPPLEPGRQLSRTRSLLTGRAFADRAEFWWGFDPFTGRSWADVLYHQQEQGRDVFGLSPDALKRTMAQAWERYKKWLAGKPVAMPVVPGIPMARSIATAGTPIGPFSTLGIGPAPTGQFSGGMTLDERLSYFRQPAAVNVPGRPPGPYNRILSHIWGPSSSVVVPKPPVAVPVRVAALKPTPAVKAKPVFEPASFPRKRSERLEVMAAWRASLTAAEKEGVKAYVGHGYEAINEYLRTGVIPRKVAVLPDAEATLRRHIGRLDAALAKARLDRPRLLYRGVGDMATMGLDPTNLIGARITDAGYLSTSAVKSAAESFTKENPGTALIRIRARAGLPGGYVGDLAELESEQEFLFARGATLVITGARKVKDPLGGADYHILDAELIYE